jgi:hypothetical protein
MLANRSPEFAQVHNQLNSDHRELEVQAELLREAFEMVRQGASATVKERAYQELVQRYRTLRLVLEDHMTREEEIVIKSVSKYFPKEEQEAIEDRAKKSSPPEKAAVLISWQLEILDAEEKAEMLEKFPPEMRELYLNVWKPQYEQRMQALAA